MSGLNNNSGYNQIIATSNGQPLNILLGNITRGGSGIAPLSANYAGAKLNMNRLAGISICRNNAALNGNGILPPWIIVQTSSGPYYFATATSSGNIQPLLAASSIKNPGHRRQLSQPEFLLGSANTLASDLQANSLGWRAERDPERQHPDPDQRRTAL